MREIGRGSSLFLLAGKPGVGKSRLLQRIREWRLTETTTHWIDFKTDTTTQNDLAADLKQCLDDAQQGDVIFIDHFESGSKRLHHQLFESWSVDGLDKKLNVIVAANTDSFDDFRQLASQKQIAAKSFELEPCSKEESEAFLQSLLFPKEAEGKLVLSRALLSRLIACEGVFTQLEKFAEQEAEQIGLAEPDVIPASKSSSGIGPILIAVLCVVIVAIVVTSQSKEISSWFKQDSASIEAIENAEPASTVPETEVIVASTTGEILLEPQAEEFEPDLEEQVGSEPAQADAVVDVVIEQESIETTAEEVITSLKAAKITDESPEPLPKLTDNDDWVTTMLLSSQSWIDGLTDQQATIQIMSIRDSAVSLKNFDNYLKNLRANQVDINQLHIFKTQNQDQNLFSIVYGEYSSLEDAGIQVVNLPKSLGANQPFVRSISNLRKK